MKRCLTLLGFLPLLLALSGSRVAQAQPSSECSGEKPWVSVAGQVPESFAHAVRSELRAGLAPGDIEVCQAGPAGAPEPLARVVIAQVEAARARYSVDVIDSVTEKRLGRDLQLDRLPADGRALALAVAAEELLRASWAELALRGVHSAQTAPPPAVRAVVEKSTPPPAAPKRFTAVGARLAFEHFLGGQTHYGADLFGAVPLGRVAGGVLAVGARRALSEQAPHGSIGATSLSLEAGVSLDFFRQAGLDLGAFVSGRVLRVSFEPDAASGVQAEPQSGLAVTSRVGLGLAFGSAGLVRSYSTLGAGLPLKSFSVSDTGGVVTGVSKLELFASTGLALELP
ncbi:MAG TPA: hypothetical protein VHP33_22805 [Polyangiaceae bacterium]|nr:hypothetical protein [Polyangiaceae bacterium]